MTIIILWLRFFMGISFGIIAIGMAVKEKNPAATAACVGICIAFLWSPRFKVRGQANLLASDISFNHFFTGPIILAGLRWFTGFFYAVGAVGGFLQKQDTLAVHILLLGLVFISPLDRLLFPTLRFPVLLKARQQSTAIIIARNLAIVIHTFGLTEYYEKDPLTANIVAGIAFGILILVAIVTPGRLIVARPVSPTFSIWKFKTSPRPWDASQPLFSAGTAGVSPKLQLAPEEVNTLHFDEVPTAPVRQQEKPKRYKNAYKVGWTATLNVTEEKFNYWLHKFQADWLDFNQYHQRLKMHRNPNEFKNQVIKELTEYIQEIRQRAEMKAENKAKTKTDCVADLVSNTFMGDKQVRSLYSALVKYAAQPNAKPMWLVGAHIAEYRAMNNLVKKIKQSQRAYAKKTAVKSAQSAPSLSLEQLAKLSDETYFKIIDYIILLGKNLENYKELNENFGEEHYRDYFLTPLNTMSPHYAAKGEVFNRKGKTDILIFDTKGNNLFVAECKLWKGTAYLIGGVDQLLNTYVNWRDEKAAIIIFNQNMKKFSELIYAATQALSNHSLCKGPGEKRTDTSWSFWFRHPDDEQRSIRLELILFNFA